jgi:peroxiredoxin
VCIDFLATPVAGAIPVRDRFCFLDKSSNVDGMKSRYFLIAGALLLTLSSVYSQNRPVLTGQEKSISDGLGKLRSLPDDEWTKSVAELARDIQGLPPGSGRAMLIGSLSNLVTEGDAGHDTLQMVASTMAQVLRDGPNPSLSRTLASLVRYEHLQVSVDDPGYRAAMAKLEEEDRHRLSLDFALSDLKGGKWSMQDLRGKVVLVNFWATWCPPCRREMPDMEGLSKRFGPRGLVILAISDEDAAKVQPFIAEHKYSYPILLDPGRTVNKLFGVEGIPKSFLYGRDGKLVAQAIDRRTERQFLEMLKLAGLE